MGRHAVIHTKKFDPVESRGFLLMIEKQLSQPRQDWSPKGLAGRERSAARRRWSAETAGASKHKEKSEPNQHNKMFNPFSKKLSGSAIEEFKSKEFEELINVLEDGVITYTADFVIVSANLSAERILGIKKENVVGKKITPEMKGQKSFQGLVEVIFPSLAPVVVQISESGWPQITDMELVEPPLRLRTTLTPLNSSTGESLGFIKIIRDKTRENEIFQSKREFLDVAAHQLRTPLIAMGWAFESLGKEVEGNQSLKQITDDGRELVERSLKIVNDLLDAARIDDGKFGYTFAELNITDLVNDIVNKAKRAAEQWGITISFAAGPEPMIVQGDAGRISMAVSNILDNAIKYNTERGNVLVSVQKDSGSQFVKIVIEDTGVGIPEKEITSLFRKFWRGEQAKQIEPNGSGLGLYIAKNILKNHGGDVVVESIPSRGSVFTLTLPQDPRLVPRRETAYENE